MTTTAQDGPAGDADEHDADPALVARVGRRSRFALAVGGVVLLCAGAGWYATSPATLPAGTGTLEATTPVDEPVYLGVFATGSGFDRTLHLAGVKVDVTSNTAVDVVPLLCRGAGIGITSDPRAFCDELLNPEGQTFGAGDSIILQVSADEPAIAVVDPVRLAFREGLQWGTVEAGTGSVVRVVAR